MRVRLGSGVEVASDDREIGDLNPDVRAIIAYNTDSHAAVWTAHYIGIVIDKLAAFILIPYFQPEWGYNTTLFAVIFRVHDIVEGH